MCLLHRASIHAIISNMSSIFIYLGIYIAILFTVVYFARRKESGEDFLISGRNRSSIQVGLSKFATSIGVAWFITYTGYAYEFGYGLVLAIFGFVVGYIVFAYWVVPKLYDYSRRFQYYTQGDFVEHMTGRRYSRIFSDTTSMLTNGMWLLISAIGGAHIISFYGVLSYEVALVITVIIVLVYVLIAGFKAVVVTDVFQSIIVFALLLFVSFSIMKGMNISETLEFAKGNMPSIADLAGFLLYGVLSFFAGADRYQITYAAKDARSAKRGILLAVIPVLLSATLLFFVGVFVKSQGVLIDASLVFTEALSLFLSPEFLPIAVTLFFAGLMSSADTNFFTITSQGVFMARLKNSIKSIRWANIILAVAVLLIGLFARDIIDLSLIAGGLTMCLGAPMIYLIAGGQDAVRFTSSIIGGAIGLAIGLVMFGITPTIIAVAFVGSLVGLVNSGHIMSKLSLQ